MNLNGKKFDQGKTEWDLLPLGPVEEVVKVLMHGKEKYGRDNWQLVDNPIRRYYSAAQRHLAAFRRARFDTKNPFDAVDSESKLHHLAHAACCILFLLWHERKELCQEDAAGAILDRLMGALAAARTEAPDTSETDAEFDDALNTLRDLGVIREAASRKPLWGDSMAGKTEAQQDKINASLRANADLGKPVLVREITEEIKFAVYDSDALDKLTVRDVPEIERKAFGALDKGKDRFKVKGVKFVRIA